MKGVILAAGYGTRFLPATKTIPKEMFPLVDTPAISLIVDEMIQAGIKDILIVTSRRKKALEDYFDREMELEAAFGAEGAGKKLAKIAHPDLNVFFVRQNQMAGTGDALMLVEPFAGDSPFVVAYPDDVLLSGPSLSGQLIETFRRTGCTVLAGQEKLQGDISRYGVMATEDSSAGEMVRRMVEKPAPGTEPSRLVGYGRYLYTPDLFDALRESRKGFTGGEFTQTEAINLLAGRGLVSVCRFQGRLLDVGSPGGYLEAVIEYALSRAEFRPGLLETMRKILEREGE
ncbi:MAG: UTP--glucose-1-phosphate uridylyltransferase [Deltaproteobacteria bacterium]|nr:UTP--glucose-1-phosphate uridylyltransferase [Deltaproteobacteria bacterium]